VPSSTVFTLVPVADAAMLRRRLLVRHQVLVRDCASFGLPDFLRLAARPAPERTRLVAALAEELA
jgi:histidinol-phosphate/aromatic aminotransferase/cobyric acid decarboxylase-like protein